MKACIYVDAFNLYYGCLKNTPFKWLDLSLLCQHELPDIQIQRIPVFPARVRARPNDPSQPTRQLIYFRALETLPDLTIHLGRGVENTVTMRLENPSPGQSAFARVIETEEKGSDVNLASHPSPGAFKPNHKKAAFHRKRLLVLAVAALLVVFIAAQLPRI